MRIRQVLLIVAFLLLAGIVFAAPPPDTLPYPIQSHLSLNHSNVFMVPQVSSPPIQFQNAGTPIGVSFTFNCSTGTTCSMVGGVMTLTAGSGGTISSCATSDALAYYSASTTLNCDGSITTNTTGTLTDVVTIAGNGTVSNPSFAFAGQTGLGFYRRAGDNIGIADSSEVVEFSGVSPVGVRLGNGGALQWTNAAPGTSPDTGISRIAPLIVAPGNGNGANSSGFFKSAMTVTTAADVTCGTTGTIADCTSAQTITGLTITLPLSAQTWHFECTGVVSQATGTASNQWLIQTATNGATSTTAAYMMGTAATAMAVGAVTDQSSTTTAFQITPSWTLGGTGTKMPFRVWGTLTGVSASGTVFNLQVINPTNADLLTIFEGASCSLTP